MKKTICTIAILTLLCGCASNTAASTPTPSAAATTAPIIFEDVGIQVIHAGYRTQTIATYVNQGTNTKKLDKQVPDQKTVTVYNYDGKPIKIATYEKQENQEVMVSTVIFEYEDQRVTNVTTKDTEGNEILSVHNEDGSWTDTDTEGNPLETTAQRDANGNATVQNTENGYKVTEYFANGLLAKETYYNTEGTYQSETIYQRYVNDPLADQITEKSEEQTKTWSLVRGQENSGKRLSYYKEGEETVREIEQNLNENGLIETEILKEAENTTVRIYTYE